MTNDFSTISAANKTLSLITTVEIPATIAEISTRPHCTQCNALYSTSKQCHVMSTCCDTAVILRQLFWNLRMLSLAAWRMQHVSPKVKVIITWLVWKDLSFYIDKGLSRLAWGTVHFVPWPSPPRAPSGSRSTTTLFRSATSCIHGHLIPHRPWLLEQKSVITFPVDWQIWIII